MHDADEPPFHGYGLENFAGGDEDEQHEFGIWNCPGCGSSDLEESSPAPNQRWRCEDCGSEWPHGDEFPVRDVVWADHHEALVAAYDEALAEAEDRGRAFVADAQKIVAEVHDSERKWVERAVAAERKLAEAEDSVA